jgi:hypothetical protein
VSLIATCVSSGFWCLGVCVCVCTCACLGLYAILVFPRFLCVVIRAMAVSLIATCFTGFKGLCVCAPR